jgi:hypothetical protein
VQDQPRVLVAFDHVDDVSGAARAMHRDQYRLVDARLEYVGEDAQSVLSHGSSVQADFADDREVWQERTQSIGIEAGTGGRNPRVYTEPPGQSSILARSNVFCLVEAACHGEYLGVAECGELGLGDVWGDVRVAIQREQETGAERDERFAKIAETIPCSPTINERPPASSRSSRSSSLFGTDWFPALGRPYFLRAIES